MLSISLPLLFVVVYFDADYLDVHLWVCVNYHPLFFREARIAMASEQIITLLRQGKNSWNEWRLLHPDVQIDLSEVRLHDIQLSGMDLSGAILYKANLSGMCLVGVNFSVAALIEADLSDADMTMADLSEADLSYADLTGVVLDDAVITNARFDHAILEGALINGSDLSILVSKGQLKRYLEHAWPKRPHISLGTDA